MFLRYFKINLQQQRASENLTNVDATLFTSLLLYLCMLFQERFETFFKLAKEIDSFLHLRT